MAKVLSAQATQPVYRSTKPNAADRSTPARRFFSCGPSKRRGATSGRQRRSHRFCAHTGLNSASQVSHAPDPDSSTNSKEEPHGQVQAAAPPPLDVAEAAAAALAVDTAQPQPKTREQRLQEILAFCLPVVLVPLADPVSRCWGAWCRLLSLTRPGACCRPPMKH
jgi:hypothetical protein